MNSKTENNTIYCNMNVFTPTECESHIQTTRQLFQTVQRIHEIQNGYEFIFLNHGSESMAAFAEFISNERRCCPFLEFTLKIPSKDELISLQLTGPEGTQEFLREEFSEAFS